MSLPHLPFPARPSGRWYRTPAASPSFPLPTAHLTCKRYPTPIRRDSCRCVLPLPLLFHGLTPHPHPPFVPRTGLQCSQCQSHRIPKVAKRQSRPINEIIDFDSVYSTIATSPQSRVYSLTASKNVSVYLINIRCFNQLAVFFLLPRRYTMRTSADRTTNML